MKIKHLFFAVLAMAAVATGCEKEKSNDKPSLKLDPSALEFESVAGTKTVKVDANQTWEIDEYDDDWVTLSQTEGDGAADIEVSVLANTGVTREAKITFRCSIVKKTLTIKQTGDGKVKTITVADFIKNADKTTAYNLEGTVSGFNSTYCSFNLTDATGTIYVYSVTDASKTAWKDKIKNGGTVVVSGKYDYFSTKELHEVVSAEILSFKEGETPDYEKAEEKTVKAFIEAANTTTYYKLTGKVSNLTSTYLNFDLTDATGSIYVYGATNKTSSTIASGGTVTIAGKYEKYGDKNEVVDAYILSFEAGAVETAEVTGLAVAVSTAGFLLKTDATENNGLVYAYDTKVKHTVAVGDSVTVKGTKTTFNGVPEITGYTFKVNSNGNTVTYPDATEITKDNIASYDNLFGYVKTTGILSISGNYYNIIIGSDTYKGSISFPDSKTVSSALNNKNIDVEGYFVGVSGSSSKFFNILVTTATESAVQPDPAADPEIKDGKLTLVIDDVKAKFSEATVDSKNGYTAAVSGFTINLGQGTNSAKPVAPTDLLKVYKGSTLSISSSEKKIKGVEFTCSGDQYCRDVTVNSDKDTVVKAADKAVTLTWSGTAVDTFKCTATAGQLRITKIVITVE